MKNVLITAIGSFAANVAIKNLKKNEYRVVGCNICPKEWLKEAFEVDEFYRVVSSENENYIKNILDICEKENINYVIPLTDVEVDVLNENREYFSSKNIVLCISGKDAIKKCRNKKVLEEFISKNTQIKTIPTYYAKDNIKIDYPLVCKPFDGRSSQGLKYIYNEDEYREFIKNNDIEKYIVQPYIEGYIVTVDVIRQKDGKRIVAIPRRELLRTANGAGTSIYVYKDENLVKQCEELANALDVCGCVNFEFIVDKDGKYHFMECNPRFSGGIEFSCLVAYDCVNNHIKCFENAEIDLLLDYRESYAAKKYETFITKINN